MTPFFGLDIGSYFIKGVELEPKGDGTFALVNFGVVPSPFNLALTEDESDLRTLSESIKELVRAYKLSSSVVTTLPEGLLFSYVVEFPKMSDKELANSLEWEAEQYIPMPLSEVSLDYKVLESLPSKGQKDRMEVALIAAPKKLVNKYIKVVEQAGLEVLSVENQTTAVVRSIMAGSAVAPTTLYVSMGASSTDFSIVKTGAVRFTRSIPTGGGVMTRAVAEKIGFEVNRAEEYKKSYGLLESQLEGKIREALVPVVDVVVSEIRRAITFYSSRYNPDSIRRVVIFGGASLLPGLLPYLATNIDLEIEVARSAQLVTFSSDVTNMRELFEKTVPISTVAIGLAMKESK